MMQSTFSFFRRGRTVDAVVFCRFFAIHFVYESAAAVCQLVFKKKGKFVASYTESRDFSFDGRVAVHKGLFYKPIDVEKEHCVSALNGTTKRSGRILVADWLQKKGNPSKQKQNTEEDKV